MRSVKRVAKSRGGFVLFSQHAAALNDDDDDAHKHENDNDNNNGKTTTATRIGKSHSNCPNHFCSTCNTPSVFEHIGECRRDIGGWHGEARRKPLEAIFQRCVACTSRRLSKRRRVAGFEVANSHSNSRVYQGLLLEIDEASRSTYKTNTPPGHALRAETSRPQSDGPGSCKIDVPTVFLESSCIVRGPGLPAVNRLGSQVGNATKQQHTTQASPECQRHGSPVVQQNIKPCEGLTWTENPARTGTLSLDGDRLKRSNRGVQPIQEPSAKRTTLEDAPNNDRYNSGRDWRSQTPPE